MTKLVSSYRPPRGLAELKSAYNAINTPKFVEMLKRIPGCTWKPERRSWLIPTELKNAVTALGQKYYLKPHFVPLAPRAELFTIDMADDMYVWQQEALPVIQREWRQVLFFEMGLGKNYPALVSCKNATNMLFVTKAAVRTTILEEISKWLGKDYAENTGIIGSARSWEASSMFPWVITSYELLNNEFAFDRKWDAIVFDESHYMKNQSSQRSTAARELAHKNDRALQLELTGTMLANDPTDAWHQLEVLWPGRFGTKYKFCKRYCNAEPNEYAESKETFSGVNPLFSDELKMRLGHCVIEATKAEYGHLLPPFVVQALRFRPNSVEVKGAMAKFFSAKNKAAQRGACEDVCAMAYREKAAIVTQQVELGVDEGVSHILVATHLKSSAKSLCAQLRKEYGDRYEVFYIDGDVPIGKKRDLIINSALKSARAILVATQHVIGTGLNSLTKFTLAILAELYWSPAVVLQFLGRFSRLNSTAPSKVIIIVFDGTYDEQVAYAVTEKINDANKVSKAGQAQQAITKALEDADDEGAFLDRMATAAFSMADDEDY